MNCDRCEDEGVIPVPGREDMVARCPVCKGMSFTRSLEEKYSRGDRRAIIIGYICVAIVGIAIGLQAAPLW